MDEKNTLEMSERPYRDELEYNLLTQRLLAEGYTAENYPYYVNLPEHSRFSGGDGLDNFYGGFVYQSWYAYEQTFQTPCGLWCKGLQCQTGLHYEGISWTFENDLALIICPYEKAECGLKHEILQSTEQLALQRKCNVHMVEDEYRYEGSVEQILKLYDDEILRKKISFRLQKHNRVCEMHMYFNKETQEWEMHYDPGDCARMRCTGYCPVLGRELDKKKGNVFYDVRESGRDYSLDGTLFEGQRFTAVKKGKRVFERSVSMDICKRYVQLCKNDLIQFVKLNQYHDKLFFAKWYGRDYSVEITNIRAAQREGRDLLQDLEDIKAGITVVHESDAQKRASEEKKERRKSAKEKKIRKLEGKILENGYGSLEPHSPDRIHADKWLGMERIRELEEMREKKQLEEKNSPVQPSVFDLMD